MVGDAAILQGGACFGHVTSGGCAHMDGVSVAMGYVLAECVADGTDLTVRQTERSARHG